MPSIPIDMTLSSRRFIVLPALLLVLAACTVTTQGGDDAGKSGEVDAGCACDITANGVNKKLACGESACISGSPYECGARAEIVRGGSAWSAPAKADGGVDATLPSPAATSIPCPYSRKGTGAAEDTCDPKTEYCILAKNGGSSAMCAPLPSGCAACGCASANADAAWRAGNNNTANCGVSNVRTATVSCTDQSGAITVICK